MIPCHDYCLCSILPCLFLQVRRQNLFIGYSMESLILLSGLAWFSWWLVQWVKPLPRWARSVETSEQPTQHNVSYYLTSTLFNEIKQVFKLHIDMIGLQCLLIQLHINLYFWLHYRLNAISQNPMSLQCHLVENLNASFSKT